MTTCRGFVWIIPMNMTNHTNKHPLTLLTQYLLYCNLVNITDKVWFKIQLDSYLSMTKLKRYIEAHGVMQWIGCFWSYPTRYISNAYFTIKIYSKCSFYYQISCQIIVSTFLSETEISFL